MKTAIVVGATGLVGSHLTRQLLADESYSRVKAFVRRPTGIDDRRLEEHIVDFERIDDWAQQVTGDVLFSALGTTLRQAGGKTAQYRVDFTFQYEAARAASQNRVPTYVLVSSAGASSRSRIFYTRMKGELEDAVEELPFEKIAILRPSVLVGQRRERRLGEQLGARMIDLAARVLPPLRKYRPIPAAVVARAMIRAAGEVGRTRSAIYELEEIFSLVSG